MTPDLPPRVGTPRRFHDLSRSARRDLEWDGGDTPPAGRRRRRSYGRRRTPTARLRRVARHRGPTHVRRTCRPHAPGHRLGSRGLAPHGGRRGRARFPKPCALHESRCRGDAADPDRARTQARAREARRGCGSGAPLGRRDRQPGRFRRNPVRRRSHPAPGRAGREDGRDRQAALPGRALRGGDGRGARSLGPHRSARVGAGQGLARPRAGTRRLDASQKGARNVEEKMEQRAWERVKRIFHEALALPAAEQLEYVKRACGDETALIAEVEELLAAHESAPTSEPQAARGERDEATGTLIGPYKLLQRIGEGGFGVVYMAEQTQPVRRIVALKIIKLGMDTRQVIARFEAERQALALMDHPNIAKVFDAGATETGRPYFVMELVRGVPITTYCDENNLGMVERLELFERVCAAIQHAHQKGIIHRDIKPSNVLVTLHDGVPVPKVIDFGIAKAMHGELTDKTIYT